MKTALNELYVYVMRLKTPLIVHVIWLKPYTRISRDIKPMGTKCG